MRSSKTFYKGILVLVWLFLLGISNVKSLELTLSDLDNLENSEIKLNAFDEIKIISDKENTINYCENNNYDLFDIVADGSSCTITTLNFGKSFVTVHATAEDNQEYSKSFYINVELENYMNDVVASFPNTFDIFNYDFNKYLPNNVGAYRDWQCNINEQSQFCDVTFSYHYSTASNIPGHASPYTLTKKVEFINNHILRGSIDLIPNRTWVLQLNNFYGSYNDLIFVSTNPAVATVDQTGKVTGINPGITTVKVYNKNDFNSDEITVYVKEDKTLFPSDLYNQYNQEITINISNNYYYTFNENNEIDYYNPIYYFFADKFSNVISNNYSYQGIRNLNCTNNLCSFDLDYYNNGQTYTLVFSDVLINLEGIYINPSHTLEYDSLYNLNYYLFSELNEEDITVIYDKSYLVDNLDGTYTPIKAGKTQITIIAGGYEITQDVYIRYPNSKSEELDTYLKNIKNIDLPYSQLAFSNYQNLNILEQIIGNKIISEYPDSELKDKLTADVYCFSANNCQVKLNIDIDGQIILGSVSYRLSKINYLGYNQNLINNLATIANEIADKYNFDNNDTISSYDTCLGDTNCLFDELFKKTDIVGLSTDELIVNSELLNTFDIIEEVPFGANFKVTISNNNLILFSKDITIYANPVIDMDVLVDSNEKESYLKESIDNILNTNVSVLNLYDNVYQVTNDEYSFNVILDKKDAINITSVLINERLYELSIGNTQKINYVTYPTGANVGNVTFKSPDESIATVSDEGIITAHKKGYTYIDVTVGYSTQKVLVVVDMDAKDVFNEFLNLVDSHQIINYYNLNLNINSENYEDPLKETIRNNISNEFSNMGYFNILAEVIKEDDGYYARIGMYNEDTYSDYIKITYEFKGIHISDRNYYLTDGESLDTNLFFTEGDNLNLYVSIEDETVASYDSRGMLTGLKTGITGISVSDKYNNYYNYFWVYVNYEDYIANLENEITSKPLTVDYIKFEENINYDNTVSNVLSSTYDLYKTGINSYFYECDEKNNVCNFTLKKNTETVMEFTIDINLVGIKLPEKKIYLDKNATKEINYELFNDTSNVSVTSLNEDICIIEDNQIKGINPGFCTIKYESDLYKNYQHVIVAEDEIIRLTQEALNEVPEKLEIAIKNFDLDNTNLTKYYDNSIDISKNIYLSYIQNIVENYLDSNLAIAWDNGTDVNNINDTNLINTTTVTVDVYPSYNFYDEDSGYSYYLDINNGLITKNIEITPTNADDSYIKLGNELSQVIDSPYYLSLKQYLMYELNSSGFDMVYYSSFLDDLYSSCPECNLIGGQGGYGVAGDGKIMQGHDYIIIKDNVPVGYYNIEVIADMDVLQNEAILSEDEYINLIKETVKEEYIAAKEELEITRAAKMANNMNSSDDIYVDVAKVFNATIPNLYNITVEDINFQTIVNNIVTGETEYTYSVTDIIFKDSSITLNVGESKIIGYTISPDNATNKNVIWESSNSSIVSVDASGGIIAKSPGNATITVKSVDGNTTKEIIVTVNASQTPEIEITLGDINLDGAINMTDLIKLRKYFAGLETLDERALKNADINKDGSVNMTDIIKLRKYFAGLEDLK